MRKRSGTAVDVLYPSHCFSSTRPSTDQSDSSDRSPMMAPTRPLPDSMSLLISSSSASAYASSSLVRPPPPPQPPLSCPPMRRKRRLHLQQQNGTCGPQPIHGGMLMKRSRTSAGTTTTAPGRTSSRCCSRLMLVTLVIVAFATLLALAIFLIFFTGQQQLDHHHFHRHSHTSSPAAAASSSPVGSASPPDFYRLRLLHHHANFGHGSPSSSSSPFSPSSSVDAPLPELLPVDVPVHFALPARHLLFTQFPPLSQNSRLLINLTVSPKARIVLLARHSVRPTPGAHDWQKIVSGDRMHPLTTDRNGRDTTFLRHTMISHFLTAGRWHFGFLNDREQNEAVTLLATVTENGAESDPHHLALSSSSSSSSDDAPCQFDCFGKGLCRAGRCVCYPGYGGVFCEETACPVLCSGNGMFSNGKCQCYAGFKGVECQMLDNWCEDPSCAGHGKCDSSDGKCHCREGWTGPNCAERQCPGRNDCAGRGICHGGKCFCALGWTGEGCERTATEEEKHEEKGEQKPNGNDKIGPTNRKKAEMPSNGPSQCPHGCAEHGTCTADGQCQCQAGWNGENCQIETCARNCSNGGQCELFSDGWRCQCDTAHFGDHCQFAKGERSCDDGHDNDGDGLTDCEDSVECCAHPFCASDSLCLAMPFPSDAVDRRSLSISDRLASPFFDRVKFLFDGGEHSVQRYADIRLLDRKRISVLRGRVFSSRGGPLTGVRISDSENPHHGFSLSRAAAMDESGETTTTAGTFELALNGGGMVSVQFVRQPFGRVPLTFYLPPNRIVNIGTVWMDRPFSTSTRSGFFPAAPSASASHCVASLSDWHFRPSVSLLRPLSSSPTVPLPSDHSSSSSPTLSPQLSIDSRAVSLSVLIPGTDQFLFYSSNCADGARSVLRVQLLGDRLPAGLLRVELALQIDGVRHQRTFAPRESLSHEFVCDRQNAFGQHEYGLRLAQLTVSFHLSTCASSVRHFVSLHLSAHSLPASPMPSFWSLSSVHRLHPLQGLIQRGDSDHLEQLQTVTTVRTIAGAEGSAENGEKRRRRILGECGGTEAATATCVGRRERAREATLHAPTALASAADGSLFVGDAELIRRVTPGAEFVDTLLQMDPSDASHPYSLAVHPFTNHLHISLPLKRQIVRVVDVGLQEIVLASNSLTFPKGIAFDNSANLFLLDGRSLKKVLLASEEMGGTVPPVVAAEEVLVNGERRGWQPLRECSRMVPLGQLILEWPTALAWDPISGQLFVLDSSSVIFRIDFQLSIVTVVAGAQTGCPAADGSAESIPVIEAISFSAEDGKLFWTETDQKGINSIKCLLAARNYPPGEVSMVTAGQNPTHSAGDKSAFFPKALAVLPSGVLAFSDQAIAAIRQIEHSPRIQFDDVAKLYRVNSTETGELLEFDEWGRHLSTLATDRSGGGTERRILLRRSISYGEDGEEAEYGQTMLSILEEKEGQKKTEVKVIKRQGGGGGAEGTDKQRLWTIETEGGQTVVEEEEGEEEKGGATTEAEVGAGRAGDNIVRQNISVTSAADPIRLQFTRDGLLKRVSNGTDRTFFSYDDKTRLPIWAKFPDGTEFEMAANEWKAKGEKRRGKSERRSRALWTLGKYSDDRAARVFMGDGEDTDNESVAFVPSSPSADGTNLPTLSQKWLSTVRRRRSLLSRKIRRRVQII
ncbi:hypothetical protein niasHS_007150 [Heterodera schachtii]|uniref:EGF-like domain-containing protein n=1 Tax=Heterodera schachtii TaxID=97005 RepID=A0ABD2JLC3_HETSC